MATIEVRIGDRFDAVRGTSWMNTSESVFTFEVVRFNGSSIYAKIIAPREGDLEYRFNRRTLETKRDALFGRFKIIESSWGRSI